MRYEITRICGHEEEVQLFGKAADRERRIARMEAEPCAACRAKGSGLEGTPKQCAWATDIRSDMRRTVEGMRDECRQKATDEQMAVIDANCDKVQRAIDAETSAKWFIEHRGDERTRLFAALLKKGEGR